MYSTERRMPLKTEDYDVLKGTTFDVYRCLLTTRKPMGVREIQRSLNLSSPSVATYHLSKLEEVGLVKRENGNYVVDKFLLENSVRISHFLVPKYLFYSIFAVLVLSIELTFLRPSVLNSEYFFSTIATYIFALIFCYETAKIYLRGRL